MENKKLNKKQRFDNDFHCHLDMKQFFDTAKNIVKDFFLESSGYLITVADPYEDNSIRRTEEILDLNKNIFAMIAAHPHNADNYSKDVEKKILKFLEKEKVIAVGEAGLDFYYNLSKKDKQIKVFRRQIAIAKENNLFLTIHSRDAEELVLNILEEEKFNLPAVFHCYTGNMKNAKEIIKRGYYISFSGIITFKQKKTDYLREIVKVIPVDRILTETDSPYLSPEPNRGKTNSPLNVKYVSKKIAELKDISLETVNNMVKKNIEHLIS